MSRQGGRARVGNYEMGRTLGKGSFGKVKLAKNMETGESVAIKIVEKENVLQHRMIEQMKREISTMKLIKHPNVIQLHEVLASTTKIYIVMEYGSGGMLLHKISKHERLIEDEARKYFQQLINAVEYCHSSGVYHRDLKPENLLLDTHGNLKVTDFGLSARSQQVGNDGLLHTTCGTPNYVAPEVFITKGYDGATADLWSCGVILFVLIAGYLPFDETNLIDLYRKITKADFTCPPQFSSSAKELITRILDPNPKTRITIPEILENAWFKKDYRPPKFQEEDVTVDGVAAVFNDSEEYLVQRTQPVLKNAFELITMSHGLYLAKLFDNMPGTLIQETLFIYKHPAKEIISKIEEAARPLGFDVQKQNYKLKLQGTKVGRKGHLSVATKVLEVAPSLFIVIFCKAGGDTLEFHEFFKNISPGLKDTNSEVHMERSKTNWIGNSNNNVM